MNKQKTNAMWLGKYKKNEHAPFDLQWKIGTGAKVKILGVWFSNSIPACNIEENWTEKINKMIQICDNWGKRNLSLCGKVCVIKNLIASQLTHVLLVFKVPDKFLSNYL